MKKIAFYTLGCKVNQADTASMENLFRERGYTVVDFQADADIYLINTCVVTNMGQRKSRQIINRAIRKNPQALVVVTGCYPQTAAEEVKTIVGVDLIIGNQDRAEVVNLVEAAASTQSIEILDSVHKLTAHTEFEDLSVGEAGEKTRAFLKIQEGCNQFCTYCIIPYARGPLRSRTLESIKTEVGKLVAAGYQEIVLIGIHLGCYGKEDKDGRTLLDAVKAALEVQGLQRLRLGSLESVEVETELLELMMQDPRLCRQLHLPLQSGCNSILERMHRPYNTEKFEELLQKIRKQIPDVAITTDIIVGFPGETEANFEETMAFVKKCGFSKMHIFPFSPRQGTPAAKFLDVVSENIKQKRCTTLAELDSIEQQKFMQEMLGKQVEVLFEKTVDGGMVEGLSGNYLRVFAVGEKDFCGTIKKVLLEKVTADHLEGTILS